MKHTNKQGREVRTENLYKLLNYNPAKENVTVEDVAEDMAEVILKLQKRINELETKE